MFLLLTEDNDIDATVFERAAKSLPDVPIRIQRESTLAAACNAVAAGDVECGVFDLTLPDADPTEVLDTIAAWDFPRIVCTGNFSTSVARRAGEIGAEYLPKTTDAESFEPRVQNSLSRFKAEIERRKAAEQAVREAGTYADAINHWVIFITGFLQRTHGHAPTGLEKLWRKTRAAVNGRKRIRAERYEWKDRFNGAASFIHRNSVEDPRIDIIAYSWGVGHGAKSLVHHLRKRGLKVHNLICCDGVYHHWLAPWRAFFSWKKIVFPADTVRAIHWFRQQTSYPRGHEIEFDEPLAWNSIDGPHPLTCSHIYADEQKEFHDLVLKVVGS